jgi:hypothetical protein
MEMTMIKKTLLVTCMLTSISAFAGDHEFLTTNPYGVDVPYQPQVIIGVEKPRAEVKPEVVERSGVRVPTELQSPTIKSSDNVEAELGSPLDRSSFYDDESESINNGHPLVDDSDLFESSVNTMDEPLADMPMGSGVNNDQYYSTPQSMPIISSDEIVSVVEQPQVNSYQRKLKGTPTEFLMVTNPSARTFVSTSDGKVYFHARKGTLEENLKELLSVTNTVFPLVYEVSNQHVNSTDVWIYGDTVLDVLNSLLINYVDPHPIRASTYANRIVEIYYDKKNRQR